MESIGILPANFVGFLPLNDILFCVCILKMIWGAKKLGLQQHLMAMRILAGTGEPKS